MFGRNILLAAAAISMARADDDDTCSTTLNVTSQSDLDSISNCEMFKASINIGGNSSVLTLNGVKNITGSLTINEAQDLNSFSAPDLETIDDSLDLEVLTVLDTLSMPKLENLGAIKLVTLPALEELQFNTGVENCRDILISDTSLKSLDGLDLSSVDTFEINNNKNIDDITVDATQISKVLDISYNADKVNVSLPNLKWVNNATFRYCSSVEMGSLEKVNNTLSFINNTLYSLEFANLSNVGSLTLSSNSELRNISFPNLTDVNGGLVVANNSHLHKIYGFPNVEKVKGAIEFEGNLSTASLPKLEEVDGGVYIDSDAVFNCSTFDKAHKNGDIYGDRYVCQGASTTISTTLSSASKTATESSGSGGSASATATSSKGGDSSKSSSSKSKNGAVSLSGTSTGIMGVVFAALLNFL